MTVVSLDNVGKAFKSYPSRWARLCEWIDPRSRDYHDKVWVLRGISFALQEGEALGLVGMNGAGKSTLLKTIAGITQPSEGAVHLRGRLAALLELGLGFHPDFTGRQNALTAGQLMASPLLVWRLYSLRLRVLRR